MHAERIALNRREDRPEPVDQHASTLAQAGADGRVFLWHKGMGAFMLCGAPVEVDCVDVAAFVDQLDKQGVHDDGRGWEWNRLSERKRLHKKLFVARERQNEEFAHGVGRGRHEAVAQECAEQVLAQRIGAVRRLCSKHSAARVPRGRDAAHARHGDDDELELVNLVRGWLAVEWWEGATYIV